MPVAKQKAALSAALSSLSPALLGLRLHPDPESL
jgi:hypothetical protein